METESKDQSGEKAKTWWARLLESISGNVELLKSFAALLANPMMVSSLTVAFVCWIFKSGGNKGESSAECLELRARLGKARRKCKKLKKKLQKARQNDSQQEPQQRQNYLRGKNNGGSFGVAFFN